MRYNSGERLRSDAQLVSKGETAAQSQESLDDQIRDLHALATRFGLYDAADWLRFHHELSIPVSDHE